MKPPTLKSRIPDDRLESIQLAEISNSCCLYGVGITRNTIGINRRRFLKSGLAAFAGLSGLISMQGCSGGGGTSGSGDADTGLMPGYMLLNRAHKSNVTSLSFNASGSKLVTADSQGIAKVWDVSTGQLLLEYSGHKGYKIEKILFEPFDTFGNRIASCGSDKTAKIWDSQNGQTLFAYEGHNETVYSMAFSPDGTKFACAGSDIHVLDTISGGFIYSYTQHANRVLDLSFSADSQLLASCESLGKEIHVIDANDGSLVAKHKVFGFEANAISFSHRGVKLAAAGTDSSLKKLICILDALTGEISNSYLLGDNSSITDIDFALDDNTIAVSDWSNKVTLWNIPTNSVVSYLNHASVVSSVSFSPDSVYMASGDFYGIAAIWDKATGEIRRLLSDPEVEPIQVTIREWTMVCQCESVCTCEPVCSCLAVSTCPSNYGCSSNVGCPSHSWCSCNLVCTCVPVVRSMA